MVHCSNFVIPESNHIDFVAAFEGPWKQVVVACSYLLLTYLPTLQYGDKPIIDLFWILVFIIVFTFMSIKINQIK